MIVEDWRDAPAADLRGLYEAECDRYQARLGWDLGPTCAIIEESRRSGRLPGLVARGALGAPVGWAYFVVHDGVLQVGGLVADTAAHLRHLLDRVLQAPEAQLARALTGFLFPVSPSLVSAFERQRFVVERHPYLARPLAGADCPPTGLDGAFRLRLLREVDPADVVRLTAKAYAGQAEARCFAPDGRLEQWAHYLGQLLATPACGTYLAGASFAVERRDTGRVQAAIITTALSPATAHVAQVVVDPACRRAGLARHLVEAASAASRSAGRTTLTLIVDEHNDPARRLYDRLGFSETASFIYASRSALTRRSFEISAPPPRGWSEVASRPGR
jgi:ribosomal protein S18 acetylase RimI-like enzyme